MSTHRFCSRTYWSKNTARSFLWKGLLAAALFVLLPFSSAFASSAHTLLDQPSSPNIARVGVSVVRLLVSYLTTNGTNKQSPTEIQCTGLGVLVSSYTSASSSDQNTWILTDGSLVNGKIVKTSGSLACSSSSFPAQLSSVQIFLSTAYNQQSTSISLSGSSLQADIHCQNTADCSKGLALFSFNNDHLLPYIDVAKPSLNTVPQVAVGLSHSASTADVPPASIPDALHNPQYAHTILPSFLTPSQMATNNPNIEVGTPIIDDSGNLQGMHLNGNKTVAPTELATFLAAQNAQTFIRPNPVHDNWNKGITAYYAKQYANARDAFKQVEQTNPQFQGATLFEQMAAQALAQSTPPQTQPQPANGLQFMQWKIPYWLLSIVGMAGLVVILLLASLLFGRSRKHRRDFKADVAEAEHESDLAVQREKEREVPRRSSIADQPTLVPEASGPLLASAPAYTAPLANANQELHCPRCNEPILPGANFCPNCRMQFTPEDSGVAKVASQPLPLAQAVPAGSIMDQPTMDMDATKKSLNGQGQHESAKTEPYNVSQLQGKRSGLLIVTRTNPGIKRKHKPNEDSLFAGQFTHDEHTVPQHVSLIVVADGMGGHANGQDASRMAIQTIVDYILPRLAHNDIPASGDYKQLLLDGVQSANKAVHQQNVEQRGDSGTTITSALVVDSTAYIANVGDSRTYLYRESEGLQKVTQDHSVVASLVAAGIIKPDDIYTHPKRNQIYRSLGERQVVEIDPFIVPLLPGDKLLLCSDGLWDMVRDPQIENVIKSSATSLEATGDGLIKAALDGGGEDNVSIIVAQVAEVADSRKKPSFQLVYKPDTVKLPPL